MPFVIQVVTKLWNLIILAKSNLKLTKVQLNVGSPCTLTTPVFNLTCTI